MKKRYRYISTIAAMSLLTGAISGCGRASDTAAETNDTTTAKSDSYETGATKSESYETTAESDESYYVPQIESSATQGCDSAYCDKLYETDTETVDYYPDFYVEPNTESYEAKEENGFKLVQTAPLSTFAADVDTASYTNIRRMIENGYTLKDINPDAVRPEEFINYFSYDLNDPSGNDRFGFTTEISTCPWNDNHKLLFVGMKTQDIDLREMPDNNLVFLIDVSGSMDEDNKLPLLQKSFKELVDELPDRGTVSIVTYSGSESVVLDGESMGNKSVIKDKIDNLYASGCTNGERGIQKAYEVAQKNYIDGGNNRVIMATDGDLNVGISDPDDLEKFIKDKKDRGVFLSVLGFGMGNYKDDRLERLADCGNGNYAYIDSMLEAKKVLIDEMGGTLVTVAKDVKLQVEFNPSKVNAYRLIGYENRVMADTDFNDDTKDGGEIGAGHSVVALYEFVPQDSSEALNLKYSKSDTTDNTSNEFATLSVRYKDPEKNKSDIVKVPIDNEAVNDTPSQNIVFASMVAEFAMILQGSDNKGTATFDDIMDTYKTLSVKDEYKDEFYQMVRMVAKRG